MFDNRTIFVNTFRMDEAKASRILEAAEAVFLRYGFRRTTMGDLASAAGLSRPALYLLFCNKERIFEGVCRRLGDRILDDVDRGLEGLEDPAERLRLAFELWAVRPFILMTEAPDARDLVEGLAFAREVVDRACAAFETRIAGILGPLQAARPGSPGPAATAHILVAAVRGFKASARSAPELRSMIEGLLAVVLAAYA
jgi:AcrR family transcriptional regulator